MKDKEYVLNVNRGTLHIRENPSCASSKIKVQESQYFKFYNTEDEAIAENQRHMRYCKTCFSGR